MSGSILIVDEVSTNRIVQRSVLTTAGYKVSTAESYASALEALRSGGFDVVIAAMGRSTIKARAFFSQIKTLRDAPTVLAITDSSIEGRARGFEAGANDVIARPPDQALLLSRLRALMRVRRTNLMQDMFLLPGGGLSEAAANFTPQPKVAILCDPGKPRDDIQESLTKLSGCDCQGLTVADLEVPRALIRFDAVVIIPSATSTADTAWAQFNTARSLGQWAGRVCIFAPHPSQQGLASRALDAGADDVIDGPFSALELGYRIKAQLALRKALPASCRDPLTGLPNHRYAFPMLSRYIDETSRTGVSFALLKLQLDNAAEILARHGPAKTDEVTAEVVARLRGILPNEALLAHLTVPSEFLVLLPATGVASARRMALRLCHVVSDTPCGLPGTQSSVSVKLTVGIALSQLMTQGDPGTRAKSLLRCAHSAMESTNSKCDLSKVQFGRPAA